MVGNSSPSRAAVIIEFILEIDMQDSPIVHISSLFAKLWAIWMDYPLLGSRVIIFSLLKPTQFRIFYYITSAVISRSSFNVVIFYCLDILAKSWQVSFKLIHCEANKCILALVVLGTSISQPFCSYCTCPSSSYFLYV